MKINDGRRQIVALVEGNRKLEAVPGLINWLVVAEHLLWDKILFLVLTPHPGIFMHGKSCLSLAEDLTGSAYVEYPVSITKGLDTTDPHRTL